MAYYINKNLSLTVEEVREMVKYLQKEKRGFREVLAKKLGDNDMDNGRDIVNFLASQGFVSQGSAYVEEGDSSKFGYKRTWEVMNKRVKEYLILTAPAPIAKETFWDKIRNILQAKATYVTAK